MFRQNETGRGLFLDLDGTLADSLSLLRQVYQAFLASFGVAGTEAEFQSLNGPPLRRIVAILRESHRLPGDEADLYATYLAMIAAAHGHVPPAAGALAVLSAAKQRGWLVAVVTSSPHAETQRWLERTDLAPWVDLVVGGDDVTRGKPDPEPYRLALRLGGCRAEDSLAVEDSLQGATAASGAGLPTWLLAPALPPALCGHPQMRGCLPGFAAIAGLL